MKRIAEAKKNPLAPTTPSQEAPGFCRRLAAIFYDSVLLLAVLFAATALILPFNSGRPFSPGQIFYPLYLVGVSFLFFGWFWTHGGQTLGLRAWRIKVLKENGSPLDWKSAFWRFLWAFLSWTAAGLGFFWIFVDKDRRGWHDRFSKT
ncbi:MAG: RDD family protein, partial [Gammaproteobacteria bacterium]